MKRRWIRAPNETKRMTECGTATFTNSGDYETGIRGPRIEVVSSGQGDFKARLTWLKLRHLDILRARENTPRVAFISLPPARVFVSFPIGRNTRLTWSGVEIRRGDIVFHSRGERFHQSTKGASQWALISILPDQLAAYGTAIAERQLASPPISRILRPPSTDAARLTSLVSKSCRLAETKPEIISHPESARALEQELIHAVVCCLAAPDL
jgi:hypothetical protein